MMAAYHKRLNSSDEGERLTAARAWSKWEMSTSRLQTSPEDIEKAAEDDWVRSHPFLFTTIHSPVLNIG
jgi:proline iminopeptidase